MAEFDFDVDVEEFNRQLDEYLNKTLPNNAEQGMRKACLLVEGESKRNCPVDFGQLRASITHDVEVGTNEVVGYVGSNVEYAIYVHEGTGIYAKNGNGRQTPWFYPGLDGKLIRTVGQKPKQFIKDSIKNRKEDIIAILKDAIL